MRLPTHPEVKGEVIARMVVILKIPVELHAVEVLVRRLQIYAVAISSAEKLIGIQLARVRVGGRLIASRRIIEPGVLAVAEADGIRALIGELADALKTVTASELHLVLADNYGQVLVEGRYRPDHGKRVLRPVYFDLVHEELRRIFESRHFRTSKRCKQFLQYVVDQKLQGHAESLKERLIGTAVFGRVADYSTGEDPVVRVQAGEVRRRLELYQAEDQVNGPLLIELPPGSYVPMFRLRQSLSEQAEALDLENSGLETGQADPQNPAHRSSNSFDAPAEELASKIKSGSIPTSGPHGPDLSDHKSSGATRPSQIAFSAARRQGMVWGVAMSLCLGAIVAFALHIHAYRTSKAKVLLTQFWNPVTLSPRPTLLCIPNPIVYRPSSELFDRYEKTHPGTFQSPTERRDLILPLAPQDTIHWGDMVPMKNSGPSIGGVVAVLNLSRLFTQQGKPYEIRFGNEASFAELRDSSAVIVGARNAQWTMQITSGFPFIFEAINGQLFIHETSGSARTWKMEFGPQGQLVRDYGLVTRQIASATGQFLVQVAGISDQGTEAASEVVSNPTELASAFASVPQGWEKKNVEIVVSTDVDEGTAGPPHVVAFRVW